MIEKTIRDYLVPLFEVPVYVDVPSEPPPDYIVIERTGGRMENQIRSAVVAIQSIGDSQYEAAMRHEDVIRHMLDMSELDCIGSVKINAEYNYPNLANKDHRYQAVFDIVYY